MFAAKLIHDPEEAVAKTLDQAILKLDALMKKGHADTKWGHNISHAAKDLEETYQQDFIRYLANPAGYAPDGTINQDIEDMMTIPDEGKAFIPEELEQRYTITRKGTDFDILVENVHPDEDEKNPMCDEKNPN